MANAEHLAKLKEGVKVWNAWRTANSNTWPDLFSANLAGEKLSRANLRGVNLSCANLRGADLYTADLSEAVVTDANLSESNLNEADLSRVNLFWSYLGMAHLSKANLSEANLSMANLSGATLSNVNLSGGTLVNTNLEEADLSGCYVYGISTWDLKLEGTKQSNLIITTSGKPTIKVDNLEVAQFIYLLLYNKKIRNVIDTITSGNGGRC